MIFGELLGELDKIPRKSGEPMKISQGVWRALRIEMNAANY